MFAEDSHEFRGVADIYLLEGVALTVADAMQGLKVSSLCELVEVDHAIGSAVDVMGITSDPINPAPPATKVFHAGAP